MRYNYIEIGTANFDYLAGLEQGPGISIEPVAHYLNEIPTAPNCIKLNVAILEYNGVAVVHYVNPLMLSVLGLPKWVAGCNSINAPHPTIKEKFADQYDSLVKKETVMAITAEDLCEQYDVSEITFLKVDAEGFDVDIVMAFLRLDIPIKKFQFELNELSESHSIVIDSLIERGYKIDRHKSDIIALR